ncbi:outer membrane beta-barrel protein [uncultured Alistipes sp.]|uniref:outer membrane beta-barrel family protein n=1 Tax=uncultured Alistipes sp. TaxID=538949 RepID=UPI0025E2D476|nr:outer membrane beta-barrel protein [uncultured Alistipes sp.]
MKKLFLLIVMLLMAISSVFAARMYPAEGRIVDEQGKAVEYATVVLLKGSDQVAGMATDNEGRFVLKVPSGEYTLSVQYLGFDPIVQQVTVGDANNLGDIVMKNSSTQIESVEVKGQIIRREADRFVVNVANSPAAMGKDGIELLETAPGVWIDNDKISINGKSGSKVYVNDRELRMEPEQLLAYLRSLQAEEIQKIEVVPTTGADYDADSSGGIIKITLKKRRENGTEGSLWVSTVQSKFTHVYSPGGNINIHAGRLDFHASAWSYLGRNDQIFKETTTYSVQDAGLKSYSEQEENNRNFGVSTGAFYELSDKHNIGAEFEYWRNDEDGPNDSDTDFTSGSAVTHTKSRYDTRVVRNNYTATFNYIWKIDTLGSTFKVLADYTRRESDGGNDNFSRITAPAPAPVIDSTYRNNSTAIYNITSASVALDKKFSPKWSLRTGAKYTYNDMHNDALYEYMKNDAWVNNENQSFSINYTENIVAAYGIASANLGRWSIVAGLRGEYTRTKGKGHDIKQDYFSLFPNANVSYSLTKDGSYSIIAQYARTIGRPRFWDLNPQRYQVSDYTYQVGNPELDPSYKHDVSLTLVLKQKYTLTGGMMINKDEIQQTIRPDANDPNVLCLSTINFDKTDSYYFSANLPFQFTKWWSMNINANYVRHGQRVEESDPVKYQNVYMANASSTVTLPAKFYIDLSYRYQGKIEFGNTWVDPMHFLNIGVKKRFGDKFTLTFTVRNITNGGQLIGSSGEGFVRKVDVQQQWNKRSYRLHFSYNFKAGKAFRKKTIESSDDKNRL